MRLFIAVNFDDQIKNRLLEIQERLRSQCLKGNFTQAENFHITLAFLGETPGERLTDLFQIIEGVRFPAFDLNFDRSGCFTHSGKELWWIGAERSCPGHSRLEAIHSELIDRLSGGGFSVDKRAFNAHITLAREVRHSEPIVLDKPEIMIHVNRLSLMKSEHIRGLLTYTELK